MAYQIMRFFISLSPKPAPNPVFALLCARAQRASGPAWACESDADDASLPLWLALQAPAGSEAVAQRWIGALEKTRPECADAARAARARIQSRERAAASHPQRRLMAAGLVAAMVLCGASFNRDGFARVSLLQLPAPARGDFAVLPAGALQVQAEIPAPEQGLASWYGPGFHGHTAADGTRFDQEAMTAAHRTLPLGSVVAVRRIRDDGSTAIVVVKITDRGPYADTARRIIDLSHGAAERLGVLAGGTAPVALEILHLPVRNQLHYVNGRPQG